MNNPYRFNGMADFVVSEGLRPSHAAKIQSIWFVGRVSDALSQMGEAPPEARPAMLVEALASRDAIAAALATVDAAIEHARRGCNLTPPEPERGPRSPESLPGDPALRPGQYGPASQHQRRGQR
jgi:hypothetical protein